jgi:hypothetical protein
MHLAVGGTSETAVDRMNSALLPAHPSPEAIADRINLPAFARDLLSLGDATTRTPAAPTPARQPNRSDETPP